ncbi:hypothetical protein PHYSODRAFT_332370 [Phytophthora sojae]|uniref:Ankyrin repeat-containing protein n=1 Tax=Phytophthora sojae (strain P6497) TaxID=1094619 RepID=G4ZGZ7_PHYSP|nr:hypothetical protein PHYSODRAFT_332370 [Phytophthora sojae]EGZ18622.1 hypothetical protein PHYSODRAFT_332370 [Phytophthora sojae]|eukprot:XP_009527680.1 hypothetical protein PHYSODRAFT_332370 [Phytophthora sojae]
MASPSQAPPAKRLCTTGAGDNASQRNSQRNPSLRSQIPHIKSEALTPEQAVIQALQSRDSQRLADLKTKFKGVIKNAFMFAAITGDLNTVRLLLRTELEEPERDLASPKLCRLLRKAVLPAASNGHLPVVEYLLHELQVEGEIDDDAAWSVFNEAAVKGHLGIVKFVAEYVEEEEFEHKSCEVMNSAIVGGHANVITFLLGCEMGDVFDIGDVFEEVIARGQDAVADEIYKDYSDTKDGQSLLARLAGAGRLKAVEHLVTHGHNEPDLIECGFMSAAMSRHDDVCKYLLRTGRVSTAGFDAVFLSVAGSGSIKGTMSLYNMRRPTQMGIEMAFQAAGSYEVAEFIFENEHVPEMAIIMAFKNAFSLESRINMPTKERESVARFLYSMECVPPEIVGEVFSYTSFDMIEFLEFGFDRQIFPPCAISDAFKNAAENGLTKILKCLLRKAGIPQAVKEESFVRAALNNHNAAVQLMGGDSDWPLSTLTEALKLTSNPTLKGFLRTKVQAARAG